ncbi:F-box domain, Phloem protein 2-like protein [Artemisia annua]|uniref:F-box domain, Phloem protein 2-like protein n=1 Tax=Artemisia annua TaxID=35608 RepID=A0A2U1P0B4_ARTAN|nr:F-box domain, Phloem protein 2-like protein [Artemisia annua]
MIAAIGNDKQSDPSTSSSVPLSQQCRHFELYDILLATENFDESLVIGKGGFGKVYKGTIFNGSTTDVAAFKRLDPDSSQGAPQFRAEVEILSKLRHCNLVSLFGYCNQEKEMILVYEYMPNGTLEGHLHQHVFYIDDQALNLASWAQENIIQGNLNHIIDSELRAEISPKSMKEFVRIAKTCLHSDPKDRPTMAEVSCSLEYVLKLQEEYNNSVQPSGRTIYGTLVNMLPLRTTEFRQDMVSGQKTYMLGARELSITWHDDTRYWNWGHVPESRFAEVAILKEVYCLDIRGKISTAILSPRSIYVAYLVFQMAPDSTGLSVPAKTVVTFGGKKNEISDVYLQQEWTLTRVSHTKRNDGWMEIKLSEFYHHDGDEGEVEIMFQENNTSNMKTGLIVEGIEIRPI